MNNKQPYSDFSYTIDLIIDTYKITNPILIVDKVKEEFNLEMSIHQVSDYLSINYEDFELENRKTYYQTNY